MTGSTYVHCLPGPRTDHFAKLHNDAVQHLLLLFFRLLPFGAARHHANTDPASLSFNMPLDWTLMKTARVYEPWQPNSRRLVGTQAPSSMRGIGHLHVDVHGQSSTHFGRCTYRACTAHQPAHKSPVHCFHCQFNACACLYRYIHMRCRVSLPCNRYPPKTSPGYSIIYMI